MDISKRDFLKGGLLAAGASVLPRSTGAAPAVGGPLRVCVFADLHFTPGVYTNDDPAFLERILARAEAEKCDMMIHLGDMIQNVAEKPVRDLVDRYNGFTIPGYHVLGNHEQDGTTFEATLEALGLTRGYYSFDRGGFRFVILDPNYFCNEPGKFIHHSKGNYFHRSIISTINWIPPEQAEWLKGTLEESPFPCVVLSHQSFERGPRGGMVCNADEIRGIFNAVNARHPGRVRLVINGHYHVDNLRILDNIAYWEVNSANMYYWGGPKNVYPKEYIAKHRGAPYTLGDVRETLGWKDPLSAILTLYPEGRIRIEGSRSDWLFGITPRQAGFDEYDALGRLIAPVINSADISLNEVDSGGSLKAIRPRDRFALLSSLVCTAVVLTAGAADAAAGWRMPERQDPERVKAIAARLRPEAGFAETRVANRAYWKQFAAACREGASKQARKFAGEGPIIPDDSRFGETDYTWGQYMQDDQARLRTIALAEAVENRGELMPALCAYLDFFSSRRTWTGRYHDKELRNFRGEAHFIELGNGHISTAIAATLDIFRGKLPEDVRERALAALRLRTIDTYLHSARDSAFARKECGSWLFGTGNWNVSCNGSMVGAILLVIDDRRLRAEAIELAERSSRGFVLGDFTAEGLCLEGTGYWGYAVGCYVRLLAWVKRATGSYLDFALNEKAYLSSYETNYMDGRGPKYGDSNGGGANIGTQVLCEQVWPGHARENQSLLRGGVESCIQFHDALKDFRAYEKRPVVKFDYPIRSWFPDQIAMYVGRPRDAAKAKDRLFASIQGSYNARPHGHNDVGSYTVAVDGFDVLDDVGSAVYRDDSFGRDRFKNRMRNSWGHSVPLVGGKIQTPGRDSRGVILSTDFTDERDTLVYDLKSAYPDVEGLEKLTRRFQFLRAENKVRVMDSVEFSKAGAFETAFTSFGRMTELGGGEFRFTSKDGQKALIAKVKVIGAPWHFQVEEMPEAAGSQWAWGKGLQKPYRAAVVLDKPVEKAAIAVEWRLAK